MGRVRGSRRIFQILSVVSCMLITVGSLVPGTERPQTGTLGDVAHLLAYTIAAALTWIAFPGIDSRWQLAGFSCAAGAFEICQIWIPWRSASVNDWIASTLGAVLGIVLARWIGQRHRLRAAP